MTSVHLLVVMLSCTLAIYGVTAFAYHWAARPGMAVAFVGYVIANAGLIWDAIQQSRVSP